jgi:hypothetical protein
MSDSMGAGQLVAAVVVGGLIAFFTAQPGESAAFLAGRFGGGFLVAFLLAGWLSDKMGTTAASDE